ncbi:MAG: rRNA maturation RNase YbeY [Parcubacteria group bacterium]|jgi:probable rRNA maturation factor
MQLNLEINNATQSPIADSFLVAVAEKTIQELITELNHEFLKEKDISISLALVSPEEIQKLNKEYRQKDDVTDILSFPEYENLAQIKDAVDNELFLGELILCYDDIEEYARKENIALDQELANVVSHGVLHLLGFTHGEKMFGLQEKIKKDF